MRKLSDKIFLSPPALGGDEIKYICKAIESNWIAPAGPYFEDFEEKTDCIGSLETILNTEPVVFHSLMILYLFFYFHYSFPFPNLVFCIK